MPVKGENQGSPHGNQDFSKLSQYFSFNFFLLERYVFPLSNEPLTSIIGSLVLARQLIELADPPSVGIFQYPCSYFAEISDLSWGVVGKIGRFLTHFFSVFALKTTKKVQFFSGSRAGSKNSGRSYFFSEIFKSDLGGSYFFAEIFKSEPGGSYRGGGVLNTNSPVR